MAVNRTICFGNELYDLVEKAVEENKDIPSFNKFVNEAVRAYIDIDKTVNDAVHEHKENMQQILTEQHTFS